MIYGLNSRERTKLPPLLAVVKPASAAVESMEFHMNLYYLREKSTKNGNFLAMVWDRLPRQRTILACMRARDEDCEYCAQHLPPCRSLVFKRVNSEFEVEGPWCIGIILLFIVSKHQAFASEKHTKA